MNDHHRDNPLRSALFTDMYELTMAQAYHAEGMDQVAVFELFFRSLPPGRKFLVAAGLDDVLTYLETLHFTDDDLAYLRGLGPFSEPFLQRLKGERFALDVDAVAEGTVVFPHEPLVQVTGPILQAQLVETLVLNQIHFQSLVATKAARVVMAAAGRTVVDFGSRRAHGADAAMKVARASYLVGADGTSNVLAGKVYGIPVYGTMAHSYIQAHDDEYQALKSFAELFPETTLLVDTYDTLEGVAKVIALAGELGKPFRVRAIRLDSGDLGQLAKQSRNMFDEAGLSEVKIFASSGLDEYEIAALVASGAPIDGFGVGTKLAVITDAPHVDLAYKLVEYADAPRMKLSPDKVIYPGRKQVFRTVERGRMVRDTIGRHDERLAGNSLLQPVMRGGQRLAAGRIGLEEARAHARRELESLPDALRRLEPSGAPYAAEASDALRHDLAALRRSFE